MKHYRLNVKMKVRAGQEPGGPDIIETLKKDAKFFAAREKMLGAALWAERTTGGWICICDQTFRYCDELAMPTPAPDPNPQPAPTGDYEQRIRDLERKVAILFEFVAAHKND